MLMGLNIDKLQHFSYHCVLNMGNFKESSARNVPNINLYTLGEGRLSGVDPEVIKSQLEEIRLLGKNAERQGCKKHTRSR
jgi:hypothetical protein